MVEAGYMQAQIAEWFGVTVSAISYALKRAGHPGYHESTRKAAQEAIQEATQPIQDARAREIAAFNPSRYQEPPLRYPEASEASPKAGPSPEAKPSPPPGFIDWFMHDD